MSILTEKCFGCDGKFNCDYYNHQHYGVIPLICWEWMVEHANSHLPDRVLPAIGDEE